MGKRKKFLSVSNYSENDDSKYAANSNKKMKFDHFSNLNSFPKKKFKHKKQKNGDNINLNLHSPLVNASIEVNNNFLPSKSKNFKKNKFDKLQNFNSQRSENKKFSSPEKASSSVVDIQIQRKTLPIYSSRSQVIEELKKSQTTIVIGETGSGKTTQIPQFLFEERLSKKGKICITQPRRVAAITIAKRVAEEMKTETGCTVGYSVRFEDCCTEKTRIKYVTDGMLLREALMDPLFTQYQWIILDEAHERSINTDILFGVIKSAQKKRKSKAKNPLNVIVMSATMDVDHFSSYFDDAPVLYVQGRQHPIQIYSTTKKFSDYNVACLSAMLKIHKEAASEEDILIFLTGQEEIDSAVRLINYIAKDPKLSSYPALKAFPLYAALPHNKQLKVFKPSCPGERKVIVSTNIAETSVTIPGIRYVIDSGHSKTRTYNSTSGFDELKVTKISQAQAWQRTGRAGREAPGACYRIYTDEEFNNMKADAVPEILRANLSSVLLRLLGVGVRKILKFDFIDKPSMNSLKQAKGDLIDLKAIEYIDGSLVLTDIGKKMTIFPLEPQYAKLLLNAAEYSCTEEILTLISILSSESVFVNPSDKKDEAKERREKFTAQEGDHLTLLNIFKAFEQSVNPKVWCKKNYLNCRNLKYAADVRRQLRELCVRNHVPIVSCGGKPETILRCLVSCLYKNIAEVDFSSKYKILRSSEMAKIHPASTLFGRSPDYVLFTDVVRTERTFMHINSEVKVEWLMEFDSEYFVSKHIRKTTS